MEEIRPTKIPGYEISSEGRVFSTKTGERKELSSFKNMKTGQRMVMLSYRGKSMVKYVSRLVAEAFIGFPSEDHLCVVYNINGDKMDCRLSNLEVVICETTEDYDPAKSKRRGVLRPSETLKRMSEAKCHQSPETIRKQAESRRRTCNERKIKIFRASGNISGQEVEGIKGNQDTEQPLM